MDRTWELFTRFLHIGFFSIGGGYATIPLIQQQVVEGTGWLTMREFTEIITISQMTPGPLAVNTSTFVGIRIGGLAGAVVATLGCVLSGFVISLALYRFFSRKRESRAAMRVLEALKAASIGLIASAAGTIVLLALFGSNGVSPSDLNFAGLVLFAAGLAVLRIWRTNPLLLMAVSGLAGLAIYG